MPAQQKKRKKTVTIVLICGALLLAIALGIGTWFFLDATKDDGLVYSNVYAAGINLGGKTPEQAKAALESVTFDTYTELDLVLQLPDVKLIFSPEDTGVHLDIDALVDAAYAYGREGNRIQRTKARADAALTSHTIQLLDYLTLDTEFINSVLQAQAESAFSELTQATVTFSGQVPRLDWTLEEAQADTSIEHMTMEIVLGTPDRTLDTTAALDAILKAYNDNLFEPIIFSYQVTEPDPIDLQKLFDEHCVAAIDAILDESTYEITPEILGYGFDIEDVQNQIDEAQPGDKLSIDLNFMEPAVTKASLEEYLFADVLAAYSSDHVYNPPRTENLVLACQAIDGYILRPGEIFSFNDIVGERTPERGFKAAPVYSGGQTVSETGGGVCQVASTIYYCVLYADLEVVERTEHMFMVDYVPPGMDATIYWGSYDFRFKNNTDYPIRVNASTHDGQVHISLEGTETKDYYVDMEYEVVYYNPATVKYEVWPEDNEKGYYDGYVINTAYDGYTIRTYQNKYSVATNELISSEVEATSRFNRRDRLICIIGDPTAPTDESGRPIETTTAPTSETTLPPTTEAPVTETTATPTETTAASTDASDATS